jgi:hypothetical protein
MTSTVAEICSTRDGPLSIVEIQQRSLLPSQHLLCILQLLSGLINVKSRAPSPLDDRCPESNRFACVDPTHHAVSSGLVKTWRNKLIHSG